MLADVLSEIRSLREQYLDCDCILPRNFNVNLDDKNRNQFPLSIKQFSKFYHVNRCDSALDCNAKFTYCNEVQGNDIKIDYYLTSDIEYITDC